MAYTSVLLAGDVVPQVIPGAFAAGLEPASRRMYSVAEPGELDRATFDFYVEHKTLLVACSPSERERRAVFDIEVNPISPDPGEITLAVVPVNVPDGFIINLEPSTVVLKSSGRDVRCTVLAPDTIEEEQEALFKIVGTCGEEEEEVMLRVKASTAAPRWGLGETKTRVREQPLKVSAGETYRFRLCLSNYGHLEDRFSLETKAPAGWTAHLTDRHGRRLNNVRVGPVGGAFQWEQLREIWLEVTPAADAEPKTTTPITVTARSRRTGEEDQLTVQVYHTPPLFSINDMDGLDPRVHYLQPGTMTSYVLHLRNPGSAPLEFNLAGEGLPDGWTAELSRESIIVDPKGNEQVNVIVRAPASASRGQRAELNISAHEAEGTSLGTARLAAEIYDIPKIYFLVIDSLDYDYLTLNAAGDGPGADGDWLCPNIREFMKRGTSFSNAHCGMPAATDMNHTCIASGATTGTLGAYWVSGLYTGVDVLGDIMIVRPNPEVLRYGDDGKKLTRIFEMVRERYPAARSFVASNKAWVSMLHEDGEAVRWGITGSHFPVYASPPPMFNLGDPPSDTNPRDRRPVKPPELMMNFGAMDLLPEILKGEFSLLSPAFSDVGEYVGHKPGFFPDDKWFADTVRQVIREEDPEVIYVNLAAVDDAGHLFGAAWDPEEWSKAKGMFRSKWVSKYSDQARREEILDVVREADLRFKEIVDEIESRAMLDNSIIVFTADHSMITEGYRKQGYAALDLREYLRSQGIIAPKHYGTAWSLNHYGAIFDVRDETTLKEVKRQLQAMAVNDPDQGPDFHPFIVLDREDMKTGVDSDNAYLPDDVKKIAEPMELYSEYYIEHPAPPGEKIRWPDLLIFYRGHYQAAVPGDAIIKGVNGVGQRMPVFRRAASRFVGIHGSEGTTHVPMVFCGPTVRKNQDMNSPAMLHDIMPTICTMLGWKPPETAAGKSLEEIIT
jgi:arylsulfatase A-like enzyme